MDYASPLLEKLIRRLARLPGIGERGANRISLHLLHADREETEALASALLELREKVGFCKRCGFYAEAELCPICVDARRADSLLCVVEQAPEVLALERSASYRGRYHVLGGVISPLDGIHPEDLRIAGLLERLRDENIAELILALSSGVEGEATALYLLEEVRDLPVRVTRLARGLPAGSNLEFLDEATLMRAFEGRVKI